MSHCSGYVECFLFSSNYPCIYKASTDNLRTWGQVLERGVAGGKDEVNANVVLSEEEKVAVVRVSGRAEQFRGS